MARKPNPAPGVSQPWTAERPIATPPTSSQAPSDRDVQEQPTSGNEMEIVDLDLDEEEFEAPQLDPTFITDSELMPIDDDTMEIMRSVQLGSAVMFVPGLNPQWRVSHTQISMSNNC